jgi:hypothetical protein
LDYCAATAASLAHVYLRADHSPDSSLLGATGECARLEQMHCIRAHLRLRCRERQVWGGWEVCWIEGREDAMGSVRVCVVMVVRY